MAPYSLPAQAVWFITGCSTGIGHTLATFLTTQTDSRVIATARNSSSLNSLPDGPNILKLALDVTSEPSIRSAMDTAFQHWGRIDVVVNNAGYGLMADTETVPLEPARKVMETNFWGAVLITQLALPILRDENPKTGQRGGVILQITSMGGRLAFQGNSFYHASKFALEGFTEAIAKEMDPAWGVHFSCIEPGGVKTKYAETSTKHDEGESRHPAYMDPKLPTNLLRAYKESKEAMKNWAEPDAVVKAMYGIVKDGIGEEKDIPLRVPLGSDSWGMLKLGHEGALKELERVKGVSLSTSGEEQLQSIDFLKK